MNRRVMACFVVMFIAAGLVQASDVGFGRDGVTIQGVRPGAKIAWMVLTRELVSRHQRLTVARGVVIATPAGAITVGKPDADRGRALWLFAGIDEEPLAIAASSPGYAATEEAVPVDVSAGDDRLLITSPSAEIIYVGRHRGVWFATAVNGGAADSDQAQDAVITVSLKSLERLFGSANPPAHVAAGDVILIVDPENHRKTVLEVGR